jgi:chromosome segregation ATPase
MVRLTERLCTCWELRVTGTLSAWESERQQHAEQVQSLRDHTARWRDVACAHVRERNRLNHACSKLREEIDLLREGTEVLRCP